MSRALMHIEPDSFYSWSLTVAAVAISLACFLEAMRYWRERNRIENRVAAVMHASLSFVGLMISRSL